METQNYSNNTQVLERRESPRVDLEVQVVMNPSHNGSKFFGWIQDISLGGFKVKVSDSLNFKDLFEKGDGVHFETSEDFFQLRGEGGIMWISSDGNTAGVKFDELGEKSKKSLDEFLNILFFIS